MNQPNAICINIAEFSIKLFSDSVIELEEGYLPFVRNDEDQNLDIRIQCIAGLPAKYFESEPVFEAENEVQKFYSIYKKDAGLAFVIYNQQTKNEIQQIAFLDKSFTCWKIYSVASENKLLPLKYPMGPIIMHYMTLKSDAVMMHASCAFDGEKARVFTGFSGAGKSTMSKIWSEAGNLIINDDRLIVRKQDDGFYVYNTPMYYRDIPKKAKLNSVFLISHSPENRIKKLDGALAISKVMAFSIQNNFDRQFIQDRLNLFTQLCSQIGVYELGFVPDESVVNFIIANEK